MIAPQSPPEAGAPADVVDAERAWAAWRANLKQELQAPAAAVLDYTELLQEDARERVPDEFLHDLERIREAARKLQAAVQEILGASRQLVDDQAYQRQARHDLRNILGGIKQYYEVLLEDAAEWFGDSFAPDILRILALAQQMLGRLDDLFTYAASGAAKAAPPPALEGLPPRLTHAARAPAETGRLLVVEDNGALREVLCRRLEREGHRVTAAGNGREALRAVHSAPFDLILMDVLMPELGGFATLEVLKSDKRFSRIPVIMVSALDEIDSAVRCIEAGAEDYLTKPCDMVLLRARINSCLEKKRLRQLEAEHLEKIQELLHVILPSQVVPELIKTGAVQPRRVEDVAVLFADIVGFTPYCGRHPPEVVVARLQRLMVAWEDAALRHGVQKIKTIGDAFMAAAGLMRAWEAPAPGSGAPPAAESPPPGKDDAVLSCVRLGREMIEVTRGLTEGWEVRVGVHIGPVVAGVVGRRQYLLDIWGDTVNTAARMESHGAAGAINLSAGAWKRIAHCCEGEAHLVKIKGVGRRRVFRFLRFADR